MSLLNPEHFIDQHICLGAECPHCGLPPVGRVTFWPKQDKDFTIDMAALKNGITSEIIKNTPPRWLIGSKELPDPLGRNRHHRVANNQDCIITAFERQFTCKRDSHWHDVVPDPRLAPMRDSLGQVPTTYPKALLPSITAIIRDPGYTGPGWRVLVHQRRDNQHWGFVGGAQNIGESILETVHREVREETGIEVSISGLVCVHSDPTQGAICSYKDGTVHYCNLTFLCLWREIGLPRPSNESLHVRWCRTDSLPEPFLETHKWRLNKALTWMQTREVAVR